MKRKKNKYKFEKKILLITLRKFKRDVVSYLSYEFWKS